jgi:hypothetical protein
MRTTFASISDTGEDTVSVSLPSLEWTLDFFDCVVQDMFGTAAVPAQAAAETVSLGRVGSSSRPVRIPKRAPLMSPSYPILSPRANDDDQGGEDDLDESVFGRASRNSGSVGDAAAADDDSRSLLPASLKPARSLSFGTSLSRANVAGEAGDDDVYDPDDPLGVLRVRSERLSIDTFIRLFISLTTTGSPSPHLT